jgi:hypothetical protein
MRSFVAVVGVLSLAGVGVARGAPDVDPDHSWLGTVSGSGVSGGPYNGFALEASALHGTSRWMALGVSFDLVDVHGTHDGSTAMYDYPASVGYLSGALDFALRFRAPVGIVTPYVEGRAGFMLNAKIQSVNEQCNAGGGVNVAAVAGLDFDLTRALVLDVSGKMRNLVMARGCEDVGGPWQPPASMLYELGAGLGWRW